MFPITGGYDGKRKGGRSYPGRLLVISLMPSKYTFKRRKKRCIIYGTLAPAFFNPFGNDLNQITFSIL